MGYMGIMETTVMGYIGNLRYRIWVIWGSYYSIPKAIFYLLKGLYQDNMHPKSLKRITLLQAKMEPGGVRV